MEADVVIAIEQVTVAYGDHIVLRNATLQVPRHARVALLGANGSGKSSLLRALVGLLPFTHGRISLLGYQLPAQYQEIKPRLGYMSDDPPLYEHLSPLEFLRYVAALWQRPPKEAQALVHDLLHMYQIWEHRNTWIEQLSKGTRRKVALISILMRRPELLILDEPFDGLDGDAVETTLTALREATQASTLLFASHAADLVARLAERTATIIGQQIVERVS